MISTSEIKISVVIDLAKGEAAMKASTRRLSADTAASHRQREET